MIDLIEIVMSWIYWGLDLVLIIFRRKEKVLQIKILINILKMKGKWYKNIDLNFKVCKRNLN